MGIYYIILKPSDINPPLNLLRTIYSHTTTYPLSTLTPYFHLKTIKIYTNRQKKHLACLRTVCAHVENMVKGVTRGIQFINFHLIIPLTNKLTNLLIN